MTTITTTAAATQANVTVATIRTWCRRGVVTATKNAGRWVIDTTSLAHRLTIGALKARRTRKTPTLSVETMLAIGGRRWQKNGMDRIYLNDFHQHLGLETTAYKTGNVSSASFDGRGIANGRAAGIACAVSKVYYDVTDGRLYAQHSGAREYEIRFLSGARECFDLVARVFAGIKSDIAAL